MDSKIKPKLDWLYVVGSASNLGCIIAFPLIILTIGGIWLDKQLGTGYAFMFAGIGLALIIAGYNTMHSIRTMSEKSSDQTVNPTDKIKQAQEQSDGSKRYPGYEASIIKWRDN